MAPEMNIGRMARNSDVMLALAVVGVLLVLIVPIPTFMVDILLSLNIAISLLLLMVALSASKALEFSTFPSLLLFTTLFRLALNVASTRLVLLNGYAGQVINAFGHFVVGGNMVVGLVVFMILCIIQFVVIIKGAGRISEVAARFTLDAMPGKQMAIDADLNAGLINEHEARNRRQKIAQEAEFYGAMDGASKFVRGDAVAGMIIIAVNLIGGIIMGKLRGMAIGDAVQTYSILTVGDGLVTQIPSLIIATTSGIITTKASSSTNLARDVGSELLTHPRALAIGAGIMALFALVPGLPTVPFLVIAVLFMGLSWVMRRSAEQAAKPQPKTAAQAKAMDENAELHKALRVDRMSIEVGYQLIPLLDPSQNDEMLRKIRAVRKQMAQKLGIIVPPIRIHDNLQVKPNEYLVRLRGNELARGTLLANNLLAIDSGMVQKPVKGQETREPAFGLPALWIAPSQKDEAEAAGYTVADPRSVLITHLTEIIRKQAPEILSRDDVKTLVDGLKETCPTVIEELDAGGHRPRRRAEGPAEPARGGDSDHRSRRHPRSDRRPCRHDEGPGAAHRTRAQIHRADDLRDGREPRQRRRHHARPVAGTAHRAVHPRRRQRRGGHSRAEPGGATDPQGRRRGPRYGRRRVRGGAADFQPHPPARPAHGAARGARAAGAGVRRTGPGNAARGPRDGVARRVTQDKAWPFEVTV